MRQSEFAPRVFELLEQTPPTELRAGPLFVPPSEVGNLSLIPWFCEGCIQWAIRISLPTQQFRKSPLPKVKGAHVVLTPNGALLIGIAGDGIEPSTWTLIPLAEVIARMVVPGMVVELGAANLGIVRRDWDVKAETRTGDGNHHYVGIIDDEGRLRIDRTTPALERGELETALNCGRMVVQKGPLEHDEHGRSHRRRGPLARQP